MVTTSQMNEKLFIAPSKRSGHWLMVVVPCRWLQKNTYVRVGNRVILTG